ncbi:MAG: hypothetical protein M3328_05645 [Chloroflexota bacterium]|nr:hypothetical protein [Chloroflexota bacterium]
MPIVAVAEGVAVAVPVKGGRVMVMVGRNQVPVGVGDAVGVDEGVQVGVEVEVGVGVEVGVLVRVGVSVMVGVLVGVLVGSVPVGV